jgi:hypothetical protein
MNQKNKEDFLNKYIAILMKSNDEELTLVIPKGITVEELLFENCGYKLLSLCVMGGMTLATFSSK